MEQFKVVVYVPEKVPAKIKKKDIGKPRYCVISLLTGEIVDDAQGYGYKTPQKACEGFSYKKEKGLLEVCLTG